MKSLLVGLVRASNAAAVGCAVRNWHFFAAEPGGGRRQNFFKVQLRHWPLTGDWECLLFGERIAQGKVGPLADANIDCMLLSRGGGGGGGGGNHVYQQQPQQQQQGGAGRQQGQPHKMRFLVRRSMTTSGLCAYSMQLNGENMPEVNQILGDGPLPQSAALKLPHQVRITNTRRHTERGGGGEWVMYECVTTLVSGCAPVLAAATAEAEAAAAAAAGEWAGGGGGGGGRGRGGGGGGAAAAAAAGGGGGGGGGAPPPPPPPPQPPSVGGGGAWGQAGAPAVPPPLEQPGVAGGMGGVAGGEAVGGTAAASSGGTTITVWHRYSDFLQLDTDLRAAFQGSHLMTSFPLLPRRKSLTVTNHFDAAFVEKRRHAIEAYINRVVGMPKLRVNVDLVKFLGLEQGQSLS